MEKPDILRQPVGQRILRHASLDDIAVCCVLALILMDWQRVGQQAAFVAAFALSCGWLRRLMVWLRELDRWSVGLIWLALCSLGAGWQRGEASLIGWLLQTKALTMIIFVNILLDQQIVTPDAFTALLLMAVASSMLTIPVVSPMLARLQGLVRRSH